MRQLIFSGHTLCTWSILFVQFLTQTWHKSGTTVSQAGRDHLICLLWFERVDTEVEPEEDLKQSDQLFP